MDDALLVGVLQACGQLAGDPFDLPGRQGAGGEAFAQVPALGQFHDQDGLAVGVLDAVDRSDVLVLERGEQLRLAIEAGQAIRIADEVGRQEFEGDVAIESGVAGAVDLAHAAAADQFQDLEGADLPVDHSRPPLEKTGTTLSRGADAAAPRRDRPRKRHAAAFAIPADSPGEGECLNTLPN